MYAVELRRRALHLVECGHSLNSVSKQTGISRSAIRAWQRRVEPLKRPARCICTGHPIDERASYTYLLGLYLGDGCISHSARTQILRIACADAWPGLIEACGAAMRTVHPENRVGREQKQGCVMVLSHSCHWTCLFPQHGPGRKHDRRIVLEAWQRDIVEEHPWELVRGLIHSDGCRVTNWTTRVVGGVRKRYEYPRYFFTNTSEDIIALFTGTLDGLGVRWTHLRQSRRAQTISVARRESVVLMDRFVGPKC